MIQTRTASIARTIFLTALLLLLTVATASAQVASQLVISEVDAAAFPDVTVTFRATDANGAPFADFSSLSVSENGRTIEGAALGTVVAGAEIIFAIDANESINDRDGDTVSRRDKVRDAMIFFSDNFMVEGPDFVSIVVPVDADHPNGELLRDGIFVNEVKNEVNFYEPDFDGAVDVAAVLTKALDVAAENQADGRAQTIILFSDGALEGVDLDTAAIVDRAQAQNVAIFVAILGARADDNEIANMEALTGPTGGNWVHMPEVAAIEPLFGQATAGREQSQVTYRSQANSSGPQEITLSLGGVTAAGAFDVVVEPAGVTVLLDNSAPITRVAAEADSELAAIEPTSQTVLAQLDFVDGHPRDIVSAALVINGVIQQTVENPQLGANNTIELTWDISSLDADTYNLSLEVTDELGLEGASDPLPLTIDVQRPQVVAPTSESTEGDSTGTETETTPVETTPEEGLNVESLTSSIWFWVGVAALALFVIFLFVMGLIMLVRRRGSKDDGMVTPEPMVQPQASLDAEATQILAPAFVQRASGAYLEPLENANEHGGSIYLNGNNVAMGRDPKLAQIVFKDKSVSRLHARIMETNGEFRLYDEGSASGTYHNYERVGLTPQTLKDNDELHLGRVHLRFRIASTGQDDDATQVFGPAAGAPQPPPPQQNPDDLSTQPFMPHGPSGGPTGPQPTGPADEDPDGTSTQPYMPHKPN